MGKTDELGVFWSNILMPMGNQVLAGADIEFREKTHLRCLFKERPDKAFGDSFHHFRHDLKEACYGNRHSEDGDPLLDSRKVAAVLCQTLLCQKWFRFNLAEAYSLAKEKKDSLSHLEYTIWATNNTLINYKFAYYVSCELVRQSLLAELAERYPLHSRIFQQLNQQGRLSPYLLEQGCDSFDVNVIVALARADVKGESFNTLLYAMILYQNEMYTRKCLEEFCREEHD